jgi:DNA-binding PadR family transcriptional regulator
LALEHLRNSLTRDNLWIYILSTLETGPASPGEIRKKVLARYGFSPAPITFYSVLYKLSKEGLVQRKSDEFRSAYDVTASGRSELAKARELLERVRKNVSEA